MLQKSDIIAQIKSLQTEVEVFLTDTATIWHKIGEEVNNGISEPVYINETNVPVRLINKSGVSNSNIPAQFRVIEQMLFTGNYKLQVPIDSTVDEGDRIEILDKSTNTTKFFDVIYSPPVTNTTGARIIQLQEVT